MKIAAKEKLMQTTRVLLNQRQKRQLMKRARKRRQVRFGGGAERNRFLFGLADQTNYWNRRRVSRVLLRS